MELPTKVETEPQIEHQTNDMELPMDFSNAVHERLSHELPRKHFFLTKSYVFLCTIRLYFRPGIIKIWLHKQHGQVPEIVLVVAD